MTMPPQLSLDDLSGQLGGRYAHRDAAARERDLALVMAVRSLRDVAIDVRPLDDGTAEVTVSAADQLGALAVLSGLFAARGLDVRRADLFTVTLPRAAAPAPRLYRGRPARPRAGALADTPPARVLLDIFVARAPEGGAAAVWPAFDEDVRATLAQVGAGDLDAALEHVIEGVAERARAAGDGGPLYPVTVDVIPGERETRLFIRAVDTSGFLFEFAAALGALRANVTGGEIRTVDGETQDVFWLTEANGQPMSDPARQEELRIAAVLIKHFTHLLPVAAEPAQALRQFGALVRSLASRHGGMSALGDLSSPQVLQTLAELLGVSRFLWEDFLRMQHENLFPVLTQSEGLSSRTSPAELEAAAQAAIAPLPGDQPESARRRLNDLKDREMFRSDLRYITNRIGFLAFSRELSDVAEATVRAAAAHAHAQLRARHGTPRLLDGAECGWTVGALGKFGGRELGYASDIELLFVYEGAGQTDGASPISNHEYFEAFVRGVRDTITAREAGIFELDLRLRPYGAKGALATSLQAFEEYYSSGGAAGQFERLALVRLRPVAGDEGTRERTRELRDRWVYSGAPIDVAEILHLRRRQATELVRAGEVNAKYSPGGVVDLEYFVQALQIEVGATDPSVRVPGTLEAVELLALAGALPDLLAGKIQEAYGFMRRLIDALRVVRGNAKDLAIPAPGTRAFGYLTRRMQYLSPADLDRAIALRMDFGRTLWERFGERE
jgi:[glutamine synthetase] adenylyltransferase / [glutamine synthetase]-adenylyl-L-tyrosine phosphorylase